MVEATRSFAMDAAEPSTPEREPGSTTEREPEAVGPDAGRTITYRLPSASGRPGAGPEEPGRPFREGEDWTPELEAFARTLVDVGLVGEAELRRAFGRWLRAPHDVRELASELARAGVLTPYQAGAVLQGKTRGLVLGNYIVLDKLGAGGGGMVLKVRHRKLERVLALKFLPPSVRNDPGAVSRFEREVKVAARLEHPNVVAALDADEVQGLHFLVMEFVEGKDLASLVKSAGPLPPARALDLIVQAARGLQAAHERGIVHRDIKPSNLMVDGSGTVKVLDLGLARITDVGDPLIAGHLDEALTQVGSILGTVDFMAPEQALDSKAADARSDVYSLGCTLYYLLSGRPPFGRGTLIQRVLAHRDQPIPALDDAPPALADAVRRMLAKDPADRYQTMGAVIATLEALQAAGDAASRPALAPTGPAEDVGPDKQRPRLGPWAWTVPIVVLALALGLWRLATGRRVPPASGVARTAPSGRPRPVVVPPATAVTKAPAPTPARPEPTRDRTPGPAPKPSPPEAVGEVGRLAGHAPDRAEGVAVTPDGRFAVSGGGDGMVRLWDLRAREQVFQGLHGGHVFAVACSADGRRAVSAGEGATIRVWDLDARKEVPGLAAGDGRIFALACSRAGPGSLLVAGGEDRSVRVWDLGNGRQADRFEQGAEVTAVGFLPGARRALSGGNDATARLWDLDNPRATGPRLDTGFKVLCMAPSPDGRHVLVGGHDGGLTLWDLAAGGGERLEGHRTLVMSVAFLGRDRALSGDLDGTLILWDLKQHRAARRFEPVGDGHRGIAVLADGRHALTADGDGAIRLWNLPPEPTSGPAAR
jgi:tRNA A-37 threonylcarbamoyl transferase component Bud32